MPSQLTLTDALSAFASNSTSSPQKLTLRTLLGVGESDGPTLKSLVLAGGAITADSPILNLTRTWNNSGVTFTGIKANVTDTASASGSLLMDLQVGGVSKASIAKTGAITSASGFIVSGATPTNAVTSGLGWDSALHLAFFHNSVIRMVVVSTGPTIGSDMAYGWSSAGTPTNSTRDLTLFRDAAGTLAQRNGTNAQAFRLYNLTDAGLTNYERLELSWVSNVARLHATKGGTGSARSLALIATNELQLWSSDVQRWTVSTSGHFLAATDNTSDIGASGANRPRNGYFAGVGTFGGGVTLGGGILTFEGRSKIRSDVDGNLQLGNNANTGFGLLMLGGTTSSFPALKRSSTTLQARLADDSGYAPLSAADITADAGFKLGANAFVSTSSTTITLDATHNGKVVECTAGTAVTITVPSTLADGYSCMVIQGGAGQVTFAAGSGATLNSRDALLAIAGQHGSASVVKTAAATYNLSGDLE